MRLSSNCKVIPIHDIGFKMPDKDVLASAGTGALEPLADLPPVRWVHGDDEENVKMLQKAMTSS